MDEYSGNFNKKTENIKKYHKEVTELKDTVTEKYAGGVHQQTG